MLLSIDVNLLSTVNGTQCAPQAAGSIMAAAPSLGTAVGYCVLMKQTKQKCCKRFASEFHIVGPATANARPP